MKKLLWLGLTYIIICFALVINSCQKKDNENKIVKSKLSGYVQKGPFINGTSIQMFELKTSLNQTGKVFSTQIINNRGFFEINDISLSSQYVEFSANGYYFNEVTGDISPSQLSLYALSDISDISSVNVNIVTHLEKSRAEYLIGKGKVFSEAKDTAQKEVLAIFGYQSQDIDNSELLDIAVNKEENAILLAISIILQGDRTVGDLTELLANIITDIQLDGKLDDATILSKLRSSTLLLDLVKIRSNLEKRYLDLGLSVTIPDFEEFVNDFLSYTGSKPTSATQPATDIMTTSCTLNGNVNANDVSTMVIFEYGTTNSYGSTTTASQNPVIGHSNTTVSSNLTGLSPGTLYHFRAKSVNSIGTVYGNDLMFTTLGQVPTSATQAATNITTTSATLNGLVNANDLSTAVTFEYGTTNSYGRTTTATQSPVIGHSSSTVSSNLTGLSPGTIYHFRAKSVNSIGTVYGNDLTFTTLGQVPGSITQAATNIQLNTATLNGSVNPNYFSTTVIFEWGITNSYGNEITAAQSPISGSSSVNVNAVLIGLLPNTTYYFHVKAINDLGLTEGNQMTFKTFTTSSTITDIEGNNYDFISIGTQVWIAENLKTAKYNDGTDIPSITDATPNTPCSFTYNNTTNTNMYGRLYNWYAVNTGKLCPTGWHVPTEAEWTTLITYLGGESIAGGKLKEIGTTHWISPNTGATNETGFKGLPGGERTNVDQFDFIGSAGTWWSSTETGPDYGTAWDRGLTYNKNSMDRGPGPKSRGYSVRCIRDF